MLVGTLPVLPAMVVCIFAVLRQPTNLPASFIVAVFLVCGTVNASPPSGATGAAPVRVGIGTLSNSRPLAALRTGSCHGPLIIMAALPATNCVFTSAWAQLIELFDIEPSFCRSSTNCSA